MTMSRGAPAWALVVLAALLAVVVVAHEDMAGWALAGAVLAPIAGAALLAVNPVLSLGVCVLTAVATAPAMAGAVPPWTVALGTAVAVVSALAGVRAARPVPALVTVGAGAALAVALTLVDDVWSAGLVLLAVAVLLPWLLGERPEWTAAGLAEGFPSLVGHILYGAGLGVALGALRLRSRAWWVTTSAARRERARRQREQLLSAAPGLWAFVALIAVLLPLLVAA